MNQPAYEFMVRAAPYSDGSGYKAKATVEPGDDGDPAVCLEVVYRINKAEWLDFVQAIHTAFAAANERTKR